MEQYRSYALGSQPKWLARYISSMEFDKHICEYVKLILLAHVDEIYESGHVRRSVRDELVKAIRSFNCVDTEGGNYEDIHEAIEYYVSKITEAGKWLNLGKSRNDQVATALRMKTKDELLDLMDSLYWLLLSLLRTSLRYKSILFPTFTHFQPAQPGTFGHYLLSFAEELVDVIPSLLSAFKSVDKCPMGSAAAAGSTVPLDRRRLCRKLCFEDIALNTVYATTSRTFFLNVISVMSQMAIIILRLIEDMFLFSNPILNLIEVPSEHAGTSSIMPHKKNPATLEVARAELLKVYSTYNFTFALLKGLPSGYCLDLQQLSPMIWQAFSTMRLAMLVLADFIEKVKPGKGVEKALSYPLQAADLAERLSLEKGTPFRESYKIVALSLKRNDYDFQKVVNEILGGRQLPHPIHSRKNEGSPGSLESTYNKVKDGIETIVSFLTEKREKITKCYALLEG